MKKIVAVFLAFYILAIVAVNAAQAQSGPAGWYLFESPVKFAQQIKVLGNETLYGVEQVVPATSITVSYDSYITPTGSVQPIVAAGTVTVATSRLAAGDPGNKLFLYNIGANTITLTDTGVLKLAGNANLAPSGTVSLISDGVNWIEFARSTN